MIEIGPFGIRLGNITLLKTEIMIVSFIQISRDMPQLLFFYPIPPWPTVTSFPRARVARLLPQIFQTRNWWIHLRLILSSMVDDIIAYHAPPTVYLGKDVHTEMRNTSTATRCHITRKKTKERPTRIPPFSSPVNRGIRKLAMLGIGGSVPPHKRARHQRLCRLHGPSFHCSKRMKAKLQVLQLVIVWIRIDTVNINHSKKLQQLTRFPR